MRKRAPAAVTTALARRRASPRRTHVSRQGGPLESAEQRVAAEESRFGAVPERQEELVATFVTAARDGALSGLEKLLAADVTWWSGRRQGHRGPAADRGAREGAALPGGRVVPVELRDGLIADLRAVVNPDKLECVRGQLARA
ncbi:hypothetical protein [Streptomyces sp. HC307]|uniref:hypothetical protein n=1 Tax=Streptomyces flavusporus TaxID=3385496 RepID=UPI003916F037